jgi:hypothetical protein
VEESVIRGRFPDLSGDGVEREFVDFRQKMFVLYSTQWMEINGIEYLYAI